MIRRALHPREASLLLFSTALVTENAPHPAPAQRVLLDHFGVSQVNSAVPMTPTLVAQAASDPAHMETYVAIEANVILPIPPLHAGRHVCMTQ